MPSQRIKENDSLRHFVFCGYIGLTLRLGMLRLGMLRPKRQAKNKQVIFPMPWSQGIKQRWPPVGEKLQLPKTFFIYLNKEKLRAVVNSCEFWDQWRMTIFCLYFLRYEWAYWEISTRCVLLFVLTRFKTNKNIQLAREMIISNPITHTHIHTIYSICKIIFKRLGCHGNEIVLPIFTIFCVWPIILQHGTCCTPTFWTGKTNNKMRWYILQK